MGRPRVRSLTKFLYSTSVLRYYRAVYAKWNEVSKSYVFSVAYRKFSPGSNQQQILFARFQRLFHEMYHAYKTGHLENDPSVGWYTGELGFFDFYIVRIYPATFFHR